MHTVHTTCTPRSSAKRLGLLALVLPGLLAGCDSEPAAPEGLDISLRPAEPPSEPECIELAPTGDAMISNPPKTQSYGGHPLLRVGGKDESLLRFDLAAIPLGSSVESATLRLYVNGGAGNSPINIHAATSAWAEGSVTYQSFDQDFDPAVAGIIQPGSPTALKSADVTGLVSSWLLGGQANYGFLLETAGSQKNIFVSREGAAGYRPSLEVCYIEPIVDFCTDEPCQNGGTCENGDGGYTCTCAPGYEGTHCETNIDECAGDPCQNGGACSDGVAGYTCACETGWEGTNCETNTDDCAGAPCQNGGICTDGLAGYTCACDAGYSGADCEVNIDDCAGDPCQNGGTCVDGVNSYSCTCTTGYSGANCELDVDDCVGHACANESTCVDGLAAYTCACLPGFTGTYCEIDIDECSGAPCLNGGECDDGINAYECACPAGYTGDNCEIDIDECESSPCVNGNCVDLVDAWECNCEPGWQGTDCSAPDACAGELDDLGSTVPQSVYGSLDGMGDDLASACSYDGGPDRAFRFTAPAAGGYRFDTEESEFDTVISVLSSCAGPELTCDDDSGTGITSRVDMMLEEGETVYLMLDSWEPPPAGAAYQLNVATVEIDESICPCLDEVPLGGDYALLVGAVLANPTECSEDGTSITGYSEYFDNLDTIEVFESGGHGFCHSYFLTQYIGALPILASPTQMQACIDLFADVASDAGLVCGSGPV